MKKIAILMPLWVFLAWALLMAAGIIFLVSMSASPAHSFDWRPMILKWDTVEGVASFEMKIEATRPTGSTDSYSVFLNADDTDFNFDAGVGWSYWLRLIPKLEGGGEGEPLFEYIIRAGDEPASKAATIEF